MKCPQCGADNQPKHKFCPECGARLPATAADPRIELVKKEYGANINLGASNVSFGLPDRHSVNSAFLSLAIQMGATCSITDPIKLGSAIKATDLLLGRDSSSMRYLKYFRATEKLREQEAAVKM